MSDASDAGASLFKDDPELLLAAVWHAAAKFSPDREIQTEFVNGYSAARRRHDGYLKDQTE